MAATLIELDKAGSLNASYIVSPSADGGARIDVVVCPFIMLLMIGIHILI